MLLFREENGECIKCDDDNCIECSENNMAKNYNIFYSLL